MAADKKNAGAKNEMKDLDLTGLLPAGMSADDLQDTGGLTPIYSPKEALAGAFAPVCGWIDRIMVLPTMMIGKEAYEPHMILVRDITKATNGVRGPRDNRDTVDVDAGKEINIPITGNLSTNRELIAALKDTKNIYFAVFYVKGQQEIKNQISPMWVWGVKIAMKAAKPRTGIYALPFSKDAKQLSMTSSGDFYDNHTGEVVDRVPANAAQA